jgi:hypothetical protein
MIIKVDICYTNKLRITYKANLPVIIKCPYCGGDAKIFLKDGFIIDKFGCGNLYICLKEVRIFRVLINKISTEEKTKLKGGEK